MKMRLAEHIIPRVTAVQSIKRDTPDGRITVGWSSRCDCGSREDHLYMIDGPRAYNKASNHALNHKCKKDAVPWAGHLSR